MRSPIASYPKVHLLAILQTGFVILAMVLRSPTSPCYGGLVADLLPLVPATVAKAKVTEGWERGAGIGKKDLDWWTLVQEDLYQREYHITWQKPSDFPGGLTGYQAPNRAQNLRIGFHPGGILIVPRTAAHPPPDQGRGIRESWTWGLALTGLQIGGLAQSLPEATPFPHANRVEYRRGSLIEWYINGEGGIEQGIQIANAKPQTSNCKLPPHPHAGEGSMNCKLGVAGYRPQVTLTFDLEGDLAARLSQDGQTIQFTTADGTPVLQYGPLHATDATGRHLSTHLRLTSIQHTPDASPRALSMTISPSIAAYPITLRLTITALPPSADWTGESDQDEARLGYALSTAGDVNGDGYSDLIVGVPWYDGGQANEGAAFVYYGSTVGLGTTPAWSAEGDQSEAHFGASVSIAGDVNDDGYADLIIGAPEYDVTSTVVLTDAGRAYVYHGNPSGLIIGPVDWTAEGDQPGARFGAAVSTAGDLDGDGYTDVVIGAPDYDGVQPNGGAAFVYYGGPAGLTASLQRSGDKPRPTPTGIGCLTPTSTAGSADWTAEGEQENAHFGASVSIAGDVNGDGYADLIIGAPEYDVTSTVVLTDAGRAYVYHGNPSGLIIGPVDWTAEGDQPGARFGAAVSTAGDLDGDGYTDVVIGAPDYDGVQPNGGAAFVYYGGPAGLTASLQRSGDKPRPTPTGIGCLTPTSTAGSADWTAEGEQENAHFGASVSIAGDVNGDGYADLIIGAPDYDGIQSDEGAVFVYQGGPGGPTTIPAWSAHPTDQAYAHFGVSASTAGDVNGDGYSDLAIGASGYDHEHTDEGGAFVYHGGPGGLGDSPTWNATSAQAGALLGWSVSTAGDVNGDGYADVIIGAPKYDLGQVEEGAVFLYTGGPDGPDTTPDWMAEGDQVWAWFGYAVSTAGDVNGDGYADVIIGAPRYDGEQMDEGAAFIYQGGPEGLAPIADWSGHLADHQADARFGHAVSTAGDINGDGYADVVITANGYDADQTNEGAAFVYYGRSTGLDTDPTWVAHPTDQAYANFGYAASSAGDVNRDGYSDIAIGAPWHNDGGTDRGTIFVYHGGPTGLTVGPADWTAVGDRDGAELGVAVSTAGDVNGDGYSDLIAGAYRYTGGEWYEGAAFVYHGGPAGLTTGPADWLATSGQSGAKFGLAASTAGDVNGDGYADVLVGAPNYEAGYAHEGAAFIYYGGPNGLSTSPARNTVGGQEGAGYGFAVSFAGDVNGDGYGDVIIGAPTYNGTQVDEGGAFIYLGNKGGGLPVRPRQLQSDGSTPIAPLGHSDSADRVCLALTAWTTMGRQPVALQWQVARLGTPFTAATVISGTSPGWSEVLTAGLVLSQTVEGLAGGTVYRWRARLLYRPDNRLGQTAGRWLYLPWNGPQEADFRTPSALAPGQNSVFLPVVLRYPTADEPAG